MRPFDLNMEEVLEDWEAALASSGATDATREFESELTGYLGRTACKGIKC